MFLLLFQSGMIKNNILVLNNNSLIVYISFLFYYYFFFQVDSMGRIILAGGAAVGLGALCYYGLGMSNEIGALEKSMLVYFSLLPLQFCTH